MTLCILHLGSEKTGTSSIQKFFGARRDEILADGFWYPRSFAHPAANVHLRLSRAAIDATLMDGSPAVAEFQEEYRVASEAGFKAAIFSSEFFHSEMRDAESVARLREFLSRYFDRFKLVYYARRQDQMLASMHSTAVKGAWTSNPDAMSVYESKGRYYFDHLAVCDLWSGQFGRDNLVCRVYEREKLLKGDVVDDFSAVVGIPLEKYRARASTNESLTLETMWALLLLNASPHKDNKELRRKLIAMGNKRNGKRVPMLTKAQAEEFLGRFEESNRRFFQRYVDPRLGSEFSVNFAAFPEEIPRLTSKEIMEFIFAKPL